MFIIVAVDRICLNFFLHALREVHEMSETNAHKSNREIKILENLVFMLNPKLKCHKIQKLLWKNAKLKFRENVSKFKVQSKYQSEALEYTIFKGVPSGNRCVGV